MTNHYVPSGADSRESNRPSLFRVSNHHSNGASASQSYADPIISIPVLYRSFQCLHVDGVDWPLPYSVDMDTDERLAHGYRAALELIQRVQTLKTQYPNRDTELDRYLWGVAKRFADDPAKMHFWRTQLTSQHGCHLSESAYDAWYLYCSTNMDALEPLSGNSRLFRINR